ncbi:hypothetical protein BUALT_Bualt11G0011500 [Buddleja alternifolia]|uniref:Uncharacterized protein n=1 Tax=Buddleja alternifolia TaxID=168488 RepID=A0AAV6WS85_9LAMI|nr:hypothetical protein BUALT_Bualt11G0011500 [Buddleja alternifolia]
MPKFMLALQFGSRLIDSLSRNYQAGPCKSLLCFTSSFFTASPNRFYTSTPNLDSEKFDLVDYLVDSLKFTKTKALSVCSRFPHINSSEKPESVVHFFKGLGFSDTQIQFSVRRQPAVLFTDVEKILKPKVKFYQKLGLTRNHLGTVISKNPSLLTSSLNKKLKPSIGVIKKVLKLNGSAHSPDDINDLMFRILSRYPWVIGRDTRLLSSVTYLKRCGIVGSQLIMLLKSEPRLFSLPEAELKNLISRVTEMGFAMRSRMLVYGIVAVYCNSAETISRKYKLLESFGFSRHECNEMFVKTPMLFKSSEEKLRGGIEFFLHTLKLDKSVLVGSPAFLTFSLEKRMIPRYKIFEMIKSRNLLEKEPSFLGVLILPNEKFVEKYILRFADDAKDLLVAYDDGHLLDSSKG